MDEPCRPKGRKTIDAPDKLLKTGELGLVRHLRRRAAVLPSLADALTLGIGDDCAILRPSAGMEVVVTTDFSLEGRHFRRDWHSPESIGHRILARGLSDLAAMGAVPLAAFLSLAVPKSLAGQPAWLDRVFNGLFALAAATGTPLAGGDTSESPSDHLLADIVLLGQTPTAKALRRDAGRPGDRLFVTGFLGGSAAELEALSAPDRPSTVRSDGEPNPHPQLFPSPRLAIGEALLREGLARACMDLSDGLSSDLHRLCEASGVRAVVDASRLPLHPLAASRPDALSLALNGGEDYELLFSAAAEVEMPHEIAGVPITAIGLLNAPANDHATVTLIQPDGTQQAVSPGGWEHLR